MSDGDPAPLAADDDGNLLVAFHEVGEDADLRDAPLTASLVALWTDDGRLLLVFDRRRQCWELPGGMIDAGETPRQAAVRELREESGYQVDDLLFAGFAQFVLGPERRAEYAAVYAGRAAAVDPFVPNDEVAAITWWDGTAPPAGRVQPLDVHLGRLARAGLDRRDLTPSAACPASPASAPTASPNRGRTAPRGRMTTGRPVLAVVSGPSGTGKTTLARATAAAVGCPAVIRDEIKQGMVLANPGYQAGGDDPLNLPALHAFFGVLETLAKAGATVVAEAAFQDRLWTPRLEPLTAHADVRIIRCAVDATIAHQRIIDRARLDPHRAAHGDQNLLDAIAAGRHSLDGGDRSTPESGSRRGGLAVDVGITRR